MKSAFTLAAPHSGAGKTTCTLALLAALRKRGVAVQPFKVGPDYIDPSHHAHITGRCSHNLDTWMLPPAANRAIFSAACADADVALVEGVMGLYDGVDGRRPDGSTAQLAAQLGLPVILVVDARAMARSAAALVHGFATFDPDVNLAGVIWNRVGSPSHRRILDESLASRGLPPSLGAVPREARVAMPERHLGLVTPEDAGLCGGQTDALAQLAEEHIDLDRLLARTAFTPSPPDPPSSGARVAPSVRIGVPMDAAFCFYYEENLRILEKGGAELVRFRPTDGDGVPAGLDGLYLGGGYPEVHAERLSKNQAFLDGIRAMHGRRAPIYAECGGFMTLCEGLHDTRGRLWPMAGLYPVASRMNARRHQLGYRQVRVERLEGLRGLTARGHEFHYSHIDPMPEGVTRAYGVANARGEPLPPEGYRAGSALAGYIHLHFASNPTLPLRFFGLS